MTRLYLAVFVFCASTPVCMALDVASLPVLTPDSISFTNDPNGDVSFYIQGNGPGCSAALVDIKPDESKLIMCKSSTEFTFRYMVKKEDGTLNPKQVIVPAGAHYRLGMDLEDKTLSVIDIRIR